MSSSVVRQTKRANAATPGATQPGNRKPTKLLVFGAVILGTVCVTIVMEYVLVPGPAHSRKSHKHEESEQGAAARHASDDGTAKVEFAEVALGVFSFSNTTALRGVITHVDFSLAVLTSLTQVSTLESQIKSNHGRIRDAINKIVHNCNLDELNDPNLEAMKRLIREDVNELLGKRLIIQVMINDIRVIQQ